MDRMAESAGVTAVLAKRVFLGEVLDSDYGFRHGREALRAKGEKGEREKRLIVK